MNDPLSLISTRCTPQSQPDPAVAQRQKANSAGGYVFQVSDEVKIHRFLVLGTTGGTYYTGEAELTKANADVVLAAARDRGKWLAEEAVEISTAGRAPKQNPAIFALAAVAGLGDLEARQFALNVLPMVCRTGTALFTFARYVEQFRGWGPTLTRAVANWYLNRPVDDVAYQAVKYRQRDGWSHRDLLRLAHPKTDDAAQNALFRWIVGGELDVRENGPLPGLVAAFTHAQTLTGSALTDLIANYPLSWEMLPDASRTPEVWRALIRKGMPQTALIRQLPTLTRLGVLDDPEILARVSEQLQNTYRLTKARVHPVNVLVAQKTYAAGHSMRGDSTWEPKRQIVDALDMAFYAAYGAVEPANKRTLIALDISGSMSYTPISGMPLTPREASAALALVTMVTEPSVDVVGFSGDTYRYESTAIKELSISPRQRLDDVVRSISDLPFGVTDCALPMTWALEKGRSYDSIFVYTDNESWAGPIHPHQALARYRERTGINTRFAAVAMTATDYSVADPADPGTLDVAGFDSAVPNLLSDFSAGRV